MPQYNRAISESLKTANLELFIQPKNMWTKHFFMYTKAEEIYQSAELHSSEDKLSPLSRKQIITKMRLYIKEWCTSEMVSTG